MNNPDNSTYGTKGGADTSDRIFLLSIDEAELYFRSDEERQCKAAALAKANGAYINSENGNSWWWLRSPGNDSNIAAGVGTYGDVDDFGGDVDGDSDTVRPAFWLDL